ncbi:hypothetical protein NM208_g13764 [Fusarium decemcellulare]|uniref:Uncharacterized protein n=1 Tax=Fusarium decemcellulare TaxID=57161 RepID=A0ACC1RIJ2_9HYPO|nr:hypothetical protein NM208_g13764 [Fusarium decemcellulare]
MDGKYRYELVGSVHTVVALVSIITLPPRQATRQKDKLRERPKQDASHLESPPPDRVGSYSKRIDRALPGEHTKVLYDGLNPEAVRREKKYPWGYPTEAIFSRYAFIRARRRMRAEHLQGHADMSTLLLDTLVGPAYLDIVGGLHDFLLETAPHIDNSLVQKLLDETESDLGKRNQPSLAPGMS